MVKKFVVSGLVASTSRTVAVKTQNVPSEPHSIMNQCHGRSRKYMLRAMFGISPESKTNGREMRIESIETWWRSV